MKKKILLIFLIVFVAIFAYIILLFNKKKILKKEDCPEFSIPDESTNGTSCKEMSLELRKQYCINKGKILYNNKCETKLTKEDCPEFSIPDESTNGTSCKEMSLKMKKQYCIDKGTILYNNKCETKLTKEDCPELSIPDEKTNFTTCRKRTIIENKNYCNENNMNFFDNACRKKLTTDDCPEFSIPDESTDGTSCKEMSLELKKQYCIDKGTILYNNKCETKLTKEDCKKKTNKDELFPMVPNEGTDFTTCRYMNNTEKKEFCISKDMFWSGNSCLTSLKKPNVSVNEIKSTEVTLKVEIENFNVSLISIKYILKDKEYVGEVTDFNNTENFVIFKIDNLKDNTEYSVKVKFETNINNYNSPYSNKVNFKTPCNKSLFTESYCKKIYGPKGKVDSTVTEEFKDKTTKSWPFFKIPKPEECMCREMTENEKIDYCIDNFYSSFKTSGRKVEIIDDKCVPKIITLDAPISTQLVTPLNINQTIKGDITDVKKYRIDSPYRLLLSWSRPNLNITGRGLEAAPTSYNIYREINGNFELIHNLKVTKDQTEIKWVDGDNKNFPKQKYQNKLQGSTKYTYKITAVNVAGEGKPIIGSGKTIKKLITNKECNNILDDPNEKINFKGFHQVINYDNNSCVPMPYDQRQLTCESLDMIQEPYPNYYIETDSDGKKVNTCAPLVEDLKVPGIPSISKEEKTATNISLKITPPDNKGIPMLTHYYVKWKNMITGEKGRLEDVENKGLLGIKILETNKYIRNHINLQPGTTYKYTIAAVSVNDKIWRYKGNNNIDGRPVGMSDSSSISVTTNYTVPTKLPLLRAVTESLDNLVFIISKYPVGFEGGATKGDNKAVITKYKIVKNIIPDASDLKLLNSNKNKPTEFIFELNNLTEFNNINATKIQVSYNNDSQEYTIIDYDIEPKTIYDYKLYAMNNKKLNWSEINESISMSTPMLSSISIGDDVTNLHDEQFLDRTNLNKKIIELSWDKKIDPNIELYKKYNNIYKPISTTYIISLKNMTDNIFIDSYVKFNETSINIPDITPGKRYNVTINYEHKGSLKLINGYEDSVSCTNPSPKNHTIDVTELTEKDCNNEIFVDRTSITDEKVYRDLDSINKPLTCVKKNNESLTKWCKDNKGSNYIYSGENKRCVVPTDGKWELVYDNENGPCTSDGLDGEIIKCGGGKKIIKKWSYIAPSNGGIEKEHPKGTIKNGNMAYKITDCNIDNCKELCENKYLGKFNTAKSILKNDEFNNYCDTGATINSKIDLGVEIVKDCSSCGNPSATTKKVKDFCTNGLYGNPSAIDCMQNKEIGNKNDWTHITNISIDDSNNTVKKYQRIREVPCDNVDWCPWITGSAPDCSAYCGSSQKSRTVTCVRDGACNPNIKPSTQISCNITNCVKKCKDQNGIFRPPFDTFKNEGSIYNQSFNKYDFDEYCYKFPTNWIKDN